MAVTVIEKKIDGSTYLVLYHGTAAEVMAEVETPTGTAGLTIHSAKKIYPSGTAADYCILFEVPKFTAP
jgi:hypothetical protein